MFFAHALAPVPPDKLWAVVSDVTAWPRHLSTFTSVTPVDGEAPIGPGSRFAVRQPGWPAATYEVTDWTPGQRFTWVARSPGAATTATHVVTETDTGSRLDLSIRWDGPLASPLKLILGRRTQHMINREATTLCRVAAALE